jgi:hypothetical protein
MFINNLIIYVTNDTEFHNKSSSHRLFLSAETKWPDILLYVVCYSLLVLCVAFIIVLVKYRFCVRVDCTNAG